MNISLTQEQSELLDVWGERSKKIAQSTEPADFDVAETAILRLAQATGTSAPKVILRVASPNAALKISDLALRLLSAKEQFGQNALKQALSYLKMEFKRDARVEGNQATQILEKPWDPDGDFHSHSKFVKETDRPIRAQVLTSISEKVESGIFKGYGRWFREVDWSSRYDFKGTFNDGSDDLEGTFHNNTYAYPRKEPDLFIGGQSTHHFCSFIAYLQEILGCHFGDRCKQRLAIAEDIALSCGGAWNCGGNIVAISDRPCELHFDNQGRLHNANGPSVLYRDGWASYHWHGVKVSSAVIKNPQKLTLKDINQSTDPLRRVLIAVYGYERYCTDANLELLDECDSDYLIVGLRTAKLWRDNYDRQSFIDVLNSTAEPDGTFKRYALPVDARAYKGRAGQECLAALASTWRDEVTNKLFFKRPEDYVPIFES